MWIYFLIAIIIFIIILSNKKEGFYFFKGPGPYAFLSNSGLYGAWGYYPNMYSRDQPSQAYCRAFPDDIGCSDYEPSLWSNYYWRGNRRHITHGDSRGGHQDHKTMPIQHK